jgi:hypothetical protein
LGSEASLLAGQSAKIVLILNWSSTAEKVDLQLDSAKEEGKVDENKERATYRKVRIAGGRVAWEAVFGFW